ncbi:MAG: endonuclease [Bacteroidaceae bacterium]|nr:endonuclease [Bacteroidaceae bacterium]
MRKSLLTFIAFCCAAACSFAQTDVQKASLNLKNVLHDLISQHKDVGYDNLWEAFKSTDVRADGKVWDIYSSISNFAFQSGGSTVSSTEGTNYNREHSVPQSWFGEAKPMKSDLFHIYPVDGKINSLRDNHPFGEVKDIKSASANNFSKYGTPTAECGAPVNVFEPADEYKGDLARTYFYMLVCYQDKIGNWNGEVFGNTVAPDAFPEFEGYPGMSEWALKMFIKWSQNDPVSEKERNRNNEVYKLQGNRNPFIDCPGLERFIWADYIK